MRWFQAAIIAPQSEQKRRTQTSLKKCPFRLNKSCTRIHYKRLSVLHTHIHTHARTCVPIISVCARAAMLKRAYAYNRPGGAGIVAHTDTGYRQTKSPRARDRISIWGIVVGEDPFFFSSLYSSHILSLVVNCLLKSPCGRPFSARWSLSGDASEPFSVRCTHAPVSVSPAVARRARHRCVLTVAALTPLWHIH